MGRGKWSPGGIVPKEVMDRVAAAERVYGPSKRLTKAAERAVPLLPLKKTTPWYRRRA